MYLSRKKVACVLTFLSVLFVATPVNAAVRIENTMSGEFSSGDAGLQVFEYGSGVDHDADFATGTHVDTVNNSGVLELGGNTVAGWWDTDWTQRQCFDVKSSDTVAEYPIRFEVDTSGSASTGADIRVVTGTNGTLLTSYSEGIFPDSASVIWAEVAPLPAGVSSYCVYFANPTAPTVSDYAGTFTQTQPVRYYTMLNTYSNATPLQVISYVANNQVSDGTTTVTLNAGQSFTFNGVDKDTVITATGAIEGSADRNGTETLLPESYADSEFVFPVTRGVNQAWIRSPHGSTTVEAIVNGVVVNSVAVTPASGSVMLQGDFGADDTLRLRSTNGVDFLAMYKSSANTDVSPAVPWFGDSIFGVRSRWVWIGAVSAATVAIEGSDGTSASVAASDTATYNTVDLGDARGNGTAFSLTSNGPHISGFQYADQNGSEITTFFPKRLLSPIFYLPVNANYFTVACPVNPTVLTIGGSTFNCASTNANAPGFHYGGLGFDPAGTKIEADHPVYVYYENDATNDEHNLLGIKGSLPYLKDHVISANPVEKLSGYCGTWTSAPMATGGIFGTFSEITNLPAGTTATFQISTDGSAFYGPDGTAGSSFSDGDIVPYLADNASTVQIQIELCTTDPTVTPSVKLASLQCSLQELIPDVFNVSTMQILSPTTGTTDEALLRVYQQHPGTWNAHVEYVDGLNLAATDAVFTTDTPTTQVTVSGGAAASPSPVFPHTTATPYSLFATHDTAAGQTSEIEVLLVDENQIRNEMGVRFEFIG